MLENIITGLLVAVIPAALSLPFIVGVKRPERFHRICEVYSMAINLGLIGLLIFWAGFQNGSLDQMALDREHMTALVPHERAPSPIPGVYIALGLFISFAFVLATHIFQLFVIADDGGNK